MGIGARRRLERSWITVAALACIAATLAAPAAADKGDAGKQEAKKQRAKRNLAGRLDPSFGLGGKAMVAFPAESGGDIGVKYELPYQFTAGHLEMAAAPGGKIVLAGSSKVVRLLANGKPDRSFGGGAVAFGRPGGQSFLLADAAVDSQGRVLLAGSARPLPTGSTPDPLISSAVVIRFAVDGSLDASFGNGGVLLTDFGIKPPATAIGPYMAPAVGLRSIAVDSLDRPVLSGGSVTKLTDCYGQAARSTAFVARLTEAGALDPSFGEAGIRQVADFASFEQVSLLAGGTLLAVANGKTRCQEEGGGPPVVLSAFAEGSLNPNFGFAGFRAVGYREAPVMAIAPSGKIILLGAKRNKTDSQMVMRLLPNGGADPGFGRTGRIYLNPGGRAALAAVAVDGRGRLLVAGRITKPASKHNRVGRSSFLLGRVNPKGTVDRSFGRKGTVSTGFGGPSSAFATQVVVDAKGRVLVGGGVSTPELNTGGGFAIARYLPEPGKQR